MTPLHEGRGATTAQIIALPDLGSDAADNAQGHAAGQAAGDPPVVRHWHPLHAIQASLQVCVGRLDLTVGELLAAREHQVLQLDRTVDQPVDLTIEGQVVARGQLVAVDGHFAVRITELPVALGLASGD